MHKLLSLLIPLLFLAACAKQNLRNAEKSLKGDWTITQIYSAEGERFENGGVSTSDEQTEMGDLGEFSFTDGEMTYSFTRLDSLHEGSSSWTLNRQRVNSGFVRVEMYTLTTDDYDYICEFGDQTSDAEKNATEVRLIFETEGIGAYSTFHLELEKE